jgi:hypothetical protein
MIFSKTGTSYFFAFYMIGYPLDLRVVLPINEGITGTYGFCMQRSEDGCLGYQQPGWLAAY